MTWLDLGRNILTAGVTAGVVSFLANQWVQLRQLHVTHLREQLEKFYGPTVFLIRMNSTILQHSQKLRQYSAEHHGPNAQINWQDEAQTARNSSEIDLAITLGNKFGDEVKGHNNEIVEAIRNNYHLIDAADQLVCQDLVLNVVRLRVENDPTPRLHGFKAANPIWIVAAEFVMGIEKSYEAKRAELQALALWWPTRAWKWLTTKKPKPIPQ